MVQQWGGPGALRDESEMQKSDDGTSDCQRPLQLEIMTRRDTEHVPGDDVAMPDISESSGDLGHESSRGDEFHQSLTVCRQLDTPPLASLPPAVQALYAHADTPAPESSASMRPSTGPPGRILPLTRYSEELLRRDVIRTSAAAASSVAGTMTSSSYSFRSPWQRDVKDWRSHTYIPTCSAEMASSFTESDVSEMTFSVTFSAASAAHIGAASAVSSGNLELPTSFSAAQSTTIDPQDVRDLGFFTSSSSSLSSDGCQAAPQELSCSQPSDFLELKAATTQSLPHSRPGHPFQGADTSLFHQSASTSSPPEFKATFPQSSSQSSSATLTFQLPHTEGLQSAALPTLELEEPMFSLHIDVDVAAGRRNREARRGRTTGGLESVRGRTHPGTSTLRYNRRYNPGLHRPRNYRCNYQGNYLSLCIAALLPCHAMRCTVFVIVILSVCLSVCYTPELCPHGSTYDHDFFTIW